MKTENVDTTFLSKEREQKEKQQKPVQMLANPLPTPKKHVKKEMDYAFEPTPDQMHYDLNNYRLDDDYDFL